MNENNCYDNPIQPCGHIRLSVIGMTTANGINRNAGVVPVYTNGDIRDAALAII